MRGELIWQEAVGQTPTTGVAKGSCRPRWGSEVYPQAQSFGAPVPQGGGLPLRIAGVFLTGKGSGAL